jgi:transcriptional regulator with GAF, ATPase, and Fis domain
LQNREVQRLRSSDLSRLDVRVICATNVRLAELVQAKQFREDLFYRMAVFPISVPPLRERFGDITALAAHFLSRLCADVGVAEKYLAPAALEFPKRLSLARERA